MYCCLLETSCVGYIQCQRHHEASPGGPLIGHFPSGARTAILRTGGNGNRCWRRRNCGRLGALGRPCSAWYPGMVVQLIGGFVAAYLAALIEACLPVISAFGVVVDCNTTRVCDPVKPSRCTNDMMTYRIRCVADNDDEGNGAEDDRG